MAESFLTADLHLGHKNIYKYRKLKDNDEHYNLIYDAWHSRVGKKDKVFILGDVCFTAEAWADFATWTGHKVVVLGNHCTERNTHLEIPSSIELHGATSYKGAWLTHIPIHPSELRGKLNIHGHTHNFVVNDTRYIGVSLEQTNYQLVSLTEIREEVARRRSFTYNAKKFGFVEATRAYNRQRKAK